MLPEFFRSLRRTQHAAASRLISSSPNMLSPGCHHDSGKPNEHSVGFGSTGTSTLRT